MNGFFAAGQWWDLTPDAQVALAVAADQLTAAGIESALSEAHAIWAAAGGANARFQTLVARRVAREPLSHLLGYRDFYKYRFRVTADVLDPRPDTETLVDVALAAAFQSVLDLGTGSGCILLSLLADRVGAQGVGTDISADALQIASRNAKDLNVADRVTFFQSDWFSTVDGVFDLIVSNPPYIALDEMAGLQPEVGTHEPRVALTDEGDGLSCYRAITADAPAHLKPGGLLAVEIGPTQAAAVAQMMRNHGFADPAVTRDIDGRDRVVSARLTQK